MVSKKLKNIIDGDKQYLFQNYGERLEACFVKGDGAFLYDQDNKKYIDFFMGIAVCNLGHGNRAVVNALHKQLDKLTHTSNWFYNREQVESAKLLSGLAFPGRTLFINSGTEANEAAIKLARKYGRSLGAQRYEIITFEGSFHGRTFGGMSATAQGKIKNGYEPLVPGFIHLPFNDIKAFKREIEKNGNICAIMTELIQGEGGIKLADSDFIKIMFDICAKNRIMTIIDEVQTGIGRTGKPFVYQNFNIEPDVITLAKGLGNGIPVGALHARERFLPFFEKGSHGSTFGGNHFAVAAVAAVLKQIGSPALLKNVEKISSYINEELIALKKSVGFITDIRGMGLHIGVELSIPGLDLVKKALDRGLIINCTAERVIRIMPPLNIPLKTAKEGMRILKDLFIQEVGNR